MSKYGEALKQQKKTKKLAQLLDARNDANTRLIININLARMHRILAQSFASEADDYDRKAGNNSVDIDKLEREIRLLEE